MEVEKKAEGFLAEFREFISRGSVMDMAVGVIIGTAFTAIVNSLVKEVIMPFVGYLVGGINFTDYKLVLREAVGETPEVAVLWGSFIQQIVNFLIIAFVVFVMVKVINTFRRKKDPEPKPEPKPSPELAALTEIRDLLKEMKND